MKKIYIFFKLYYMLSKLLGRLEINGIKKCNWLINKTE